MTENELLNKLLGQCHQPAPEPYATADSNGLVQDSNSAFIVCTKAEFNQMSTDTAQSLFKTRHILITDTKKSNPGKISWEFNRQHLKKIGDWEKPVVMQGKFLL